MNAPLCFIQKLEGIKQKAHSDTFHNKKNCLKSFRNSLNVCARNKRMCNNEIAKTLNCLLKRYTCVENLNTLKKRSIINIPSKDIILY